MFTKEMLQDCPIILLNSCKLKIISNETAFILKGLDKKNMNQLSFGLIVKPLKKSILFSIIPQVFFLSAGSLNLTLQTWRQVSFSQTQ